MVKKHPICKYCNSAEVTVEGAALWSIEDQEWVLAATYDQVYCAVCDGETTIKWVEITND